MVTKEKLIKSISGHESYAFSIFESAEYQNLNAQQKQQFIESTYLFSEKITVAQQTCQLIHSHKAKFIYWMLKEYFNSQVEDVMDIEPYNLSKPLDLIKITKDFYYDTNNFDELLNKIDHIYSTEYPPTSIDKLPAYIVEKDIASKIFE